MIIVKNWLELSKVQSTKGYKLDIDLDMECGHIVPITENEETLNENYFKHHVYLSTHSFYESQALETSLILQKYGFDVILKDAEIVRKKTLNQKK